MPGPINVAVGVIYNKSKTSVLLSRRAAGKHLAGYWEFPGGKIDSSETVTNALARELYEELDIHVLQSHPLLTIKYDYPGKSVLLNVYEVCDWSGNPTGKEGQQIEWQPINHLKDVHFPPANKRIVNRLLLSDVYLISRQNYHDKSEIINGFEQCVEKGLSLFQLRLSEKCHLLPVDLLNDLQSLITQNNVSVIMNSSITPFEHHLVAGVHLKSSHLFRNSSRPISDEKLLGASCHNEAEVKQADQLEVDYLFISPVKTTASHSNGEPLGWNEFSKLCQLTYKPVFALGGMVAGDLPVAKRYGAQGIALIESVWGADDPGEAIAAMFSASSWNHHL